MGYRKFFFFYFIEYFLYYLLFGEEMRMFFDVFLEFKDNFNRDVKDYISELID